MDANALAALISARMAGTVDVRVITFILTPSLLSSDDGCASSTPAALAVGDGV